MMDPNSGSFSSLDSSSRVESSASVYPLTSESSDGDTESDVDSGAVVMDDTHHPSPAAGDAAKTESGPAVPDRASSQTDHPLQTSPGSTRRPEGRQQEHADEARTEGGAGHDRHSRMALLDGARHLILLFVPVTICMILVVATIRSISFYSEEPKIHPISTPYHEKTDDVQTKVWQSAANSLILLCVVVCMTTIVLLLYTRECYTILHGWLMTSSMILLFTGVLIYLHQALREYNVPMDYITVAILMWNFGVVGMVCIHWKGPLLLQQMYLILISALMALIFIKYMPDWTVWFVLGVMAVWDLVAVLCPKGPLRLLVETASERNETLLPGLVYSSTAMWRAAHVADFTGQRGKRKINCVRLSSQKTSDKDHGCTGEGSCGPVATSLDTTANSSSKPEPPSESPRPHEQSQQAAAAADDSGRQQSGQPTESPPEAQSAENLEHEHGAKLGLGDFIFYSVLVGKVSSYGDWNTTIACFVAVLVGLCFTFFLLAIYGKALPALPISITFGLIVNAVTSSVVKPFCDKLASGQIYI